MRNHRAVIKVAGEALLRATPACWAHAAVVPWLQCPSLPLLVWNRPLMRTPWPLALAPRPPPA